MLLVVVAWLLPLAASSLPLDGVAGKYVLDIDNGTLRNVRFAAGDADARKLDLSHAGIRELDRNAFDNVADRVDSLVLSDNSLTSLPDFAFSRLTGLRSLSLADNQISRMRNLLTGLVNLECLNISGNPILHVYRGDLFGLAKSARIFTDVNVLWSISTGAFADSTLPVEIDTPAEPVTRRAKQHREDNVRASLANEGGDPGRGETRRNTRATLCVSNGTVTSLKWRNEGGDEGCARLDVPAAGGGAVDLHERGIRGFQPGWYQLDPLPGDVRSLDLSGNEIAEITRDTLNALPAQLEHVTLAGNALRRIPSRVIERAPHPFRLMLNDNPIETIERDAFAGTGLTELYVNSSRLDNLEFIASLPDTLTVLVVTGTRVTVIPDGVFARFGSLLYLELAGNRIERLRNGAFRGLRSLDTLELTGNGLATVEPAAFDGLTALRVLDLRDNSIRDLRNVSFAGLATLQDLLLSDNEIVRPAFTDLSDSLDNLDLARNEIEVLEPGDFSRAPTSTLLLDDNRIRRISRGAFDLPALRNLHLTGNDLTTIDADSYEGLNRLRKLWLSGNRISEIGKGACRNLGSVYVLDVSRNPFRKLENGALHGLGTDFGSSVYIYENKLEVIHAGVFDESSELS